MLGLQKLNRNSGYHPDAPTPWDPCGCEPEPGKDPCYCVETDECGCPPCGGEGCEDCYCSEWPELPEEQAAHSPASFLRGRKHYEGKNHLGNVLVVVSDRKIQVPDGSLVKFYQADLHAYNDYYPYGMLQPGRNWQAEGYRYGFQGQESDDEVAGTGNAVSYKYRMHDARVGRFLSIDPLAPDYPWNSPYAFSENRVIDAIELEGAERLLVIMSPWITNQFETKIEVARGPVNSTYRERIGQQAINYLDGKILDPVKNGGFFGNDWHIHAYPNIDFKSDEAVRESMGVFGDIGITMVWGAFKGKDGKGELRYIGLFGKDLRGSQPGGYIFSSPSGGSDPFNPIATENIYGIRDIGPMLDTYGMPGLGGAPLRDLLNAFFTGFKLQLWRMDKLPGYNDLFSKMWIDEKEDYSGLELKLPDTIFMHRNLNHEENWETINLPFGTAKRRNDKTSWDSVFRVTLPDGTFDTFQIQHPLETRERE